MIIDILFVVTIGGTGACRYPVYRTAVSGAFGNNISFSLALLSGPGAFLVEAATGGAGGGRVFEATARGKQGRGEDGCKLRRNDQEVCGTFCVWIQCAGVSPRI